MSEQREKPGVTPEQLAATLDVPVYGVQCSGGQIEHFRQGWAIHGLNGGVAHFFTRNGFDYARARCGYEAPVRWLYGAGNFGRCRRCAR